MDERYWLCLQVVYDVMVVDIDVILPFSFSRMLRDIDSASVVYVNRR